jgi:hypothetical protein
MMVLSALRPDASLGEFLAHRARSAPVVRLAAEAIAGFVVLGAALWWNPRAQLVIASASLCFVCYALWGLLDRARAIASGRGWHATRRALSVSLGLCVLIGLIAGAGVLLSVWALALGTWIS